MKSAIKFMNDVNVAFCHAPSLSSAIRKSAEDVVLSGFKGNVHESIGAICAYLLGNVECDFYLVSDDRKYVVDFYSNDSAKPFAMVTVELA